MSYCCRDFEKAVNDGFIIDFTEENRQKWGDNLPNFTLLYHDSNGDKWHVTTFTFCPWCGTRQTIMVLK